jgi:hypothetical protein
MEIDFDEWPSQHTESNKYMRKFDFSIYDVRTKYRDCFPEEKFKDTMSNLDENAKIDSSKVYKLSYKLNFMPCFGQHFKENIITKKFEHVREDIPLMAILSDSEELSIFRTDIIKDYIEFKWHKIGISHHTRGFLTHFAFLIFLIWYTNYIYIDATLQEAFDVKDYNAVKLNPAAIAFPIMWLYPVIYESVQLFSVGVTDYFFDVDNFNNVLYNSFCIANSVIHLMYSPYAFHAKILLIIVIVLSTIRTLEMIRIYESFSPIYTMLRKVIYDFKEFLLFFLLIILFLSIGYSILQIGDLEQQADLAEEAT